MWTIGIARPPDSILDVVKGRTKLRTLGLQIPSRMNTSTKAMNESEDIWPLPNYAVGPSKHVHALGVISLNYNMFELGLVAILELYVPKAEATRLFDDKTNKQRVDTIRRASRQYEKDTVIVDLIEHLLEFFSICRQNRNSLMHSKQHFAVSYEEFLSVEKKPRNADVWNEFHLTLSDLRRMADEMMEGVFYITDVWRFVNFRDSPPMKAPLQSPVLPGKPNLPRLLQPNEHPLG
jgi:hypothetical protein